MKQQTPFKRDFLQHMLAIQKWLDANSAVGGLSAHDLALKIELRDKSVILHPYFAGESATGASFVSGLVPGVTGFVGWKPYHARVWPIAQSKLAFKAFCASRRLRTPAWSLDVQEIKGPYIVKGDRGSFGQKLHGPFMASANVDPSTRPPLAEGEFAEQFIVGQIVKAWFWKKELAALEVFDMPKVVGDGFATITELLQKQTQSQVVDINKSLLTLQGFKESSIPEVKQSVLVDYVYLSKSNLHHHVDYNAAESLEASSIGIQLKEAAELLWQEVPTEYQESGVFSTLDGILDPEGRLWCLEANCNPQLHPAVYKSMLDNLFGVESKTVGAG
jgi:hypothetical protein